MRRDAVLLAEIEVVPDRRDSLLWNFTVLGEAVSHSPQFSKPNTRQSRGWTRTGYATALCTATGRSTSRSSAQPHATTCRRSWPASRLSWLLSWRTQSRRVMRGGAAAEVARGCTPATDQPRQAFAGGS